VENVGRHSHPTAVRWLAAYRANRASLDRPRYDDRFQRMWELDLAGCVAATLHSDGAVWRVVVTNDYRRPRPLHRVGKS
jgi:cyclopropane fatty-acyl-phospholipid synthase-like methyltransferase